MAVSENAPNVCVTESTVWAIIICYHSYVGWLSNLKLPLRTILASGSMKGSVTTCISVSTTPRGVFRVSAQLCRGKAGPIESQQNLKESEFLLESLSIDRVTCPSSRTRRMTSPNGTRPGSRQHWKRTLIIINPSTSIRLTSCATATGWCRMERLGIKLESRSAEMTSSL